MEEACMEEVLGFVKNVRMGVRTILSKMRRLLNWYVIWFVLYALIFSILMGLPLENYDTIKAGPILYPVAFFKVFFIVAVMLVFISNVGGLVLGLCVLYHSLSDIWMWLYDGEQWFMTHSHGIGTEGFSFGRFVDQDFLGILMVLVFISHLVLSAKRCKENGVSAWLALIPLYNPLGLFYKKKNHSLPNKETA